MESLCPGDRFADPAELALTKVDITAGKHNLAGTAAEEQALAELSIASENLGFNDKRYFVEARRSLFLPTEFEPDDELKIVDFRDGLTFSGVLADYAIIGLGRLESFAEPIRSLCLVFCPFFYLFDFREVGKEDKFALYTPAYAVVDITEER
ncbi:hypothetical protein F4X86_02510 [Candidatus Saccharibacteria bacterium]|nr:hypothetical protein [Candidatus Saccharibacteria bacterium]